MKVNNNLSSVGTMNATMRTFDVIMHTEYGTTYNSYLLKDEKVALFDAGYAKLTDLYLEQVRAAIDPAKIDYIIAHHSEPDHTGALSALLDICPNAQVISSKTAAKWLREIMNRDFNSRTVEDGEEISLGKHTLHFMSVPFWHWPDTMFTYVPEERTLFTCDGFGAHFCDARMFDDLVDQDIYEKEFAHYYDSIMRPFADKIYEGVQRVKELDIDIICPSHGPILRSDPWKAVRMYEEWSDAQRQRKNKLAIFYASAYGNTARMAEAIAEGAIEHTEVALFDVSTSEACDMRDAMEQCNGIAIGSCTINGDALLNIWSLMALFALINRKNKSAFAFGSFGWSGEAVGMIEERLKSLRLKVVESNLKFCFAPTEDDLAKCRDFGAEFAKNMAG